MIRVMMREENVSKDRKRHACRCQLPGNAITAVNYICSAIDDDYL
jgi:hypothetical protein